MQTCSSSALFILSGHS